MGDQDIQVSFVFYPVVDQPGEEPGDLGMHLDFGIHQITGPVIDRS